jgi:hypothetical protein
VNDRQETSPQDFSAILGVTNRHGEPALVVGGHAANLWAAYLLKKEPELAQFSPFLSKDLDLLADQETVWRLAERLHRQPQRPAKGEATPIIAWFDFLTARGVATRIEVLFSVYGISSKEIEASSMLIGGAGIEGPVRVPNPVICLKMKIHNAVGLNQTRRQDVKHVKMLILCNRAFLRDVLCECEAGRVLERTLIKALEALFTLVTSDIATSAAQKFGFDWRSAFPIEELCQSPLSRVQNFLRHRFVSAFNLA